jgi:hypothetical protein
MTKKKNVPTPPQPETPPPVGPVLTATTIDLMKSADNLEAAIAVLQPASRPKVDATYVLNTPTDQPLPARRGACLKVIAVAVRLERPFTVADLAQALPDLKPVRYWVNRLVKSGHLRVVA